MRRELVEIENIEQYLEGNLSGVELNSFESKLSSDSIFRQEVVNQEIIVERINTMGKIEAIDLAHENHARRGANNALITKGVIGVIAISAAIVGGKALADLNNGANSSGEESLISIPIDGENNATNSQSDNVNNVNNVNNDTKLYEPNAASGLSENQITESGQIISESSLGQEDTTKTDSSKVESGEDKIATTSEEDRSATSGSDDGFRKYGTKMFLASNDVNAKIHFEREIGIYDTWELVETKEEARYKLNLRYKKEVVDRLSWIEIVDLQTGERVYKSEVSKAFSTSMRTVNLKQATIERLVHQILAWEFFGME
ncbi:hypothetical protein JYT74_02350 [Crocinitomix catalasitica]|nr:hypothetical protein [Crocinitomix catalasitica]